MTSADFWRCLPTPLDVGSTRHTARSPRVLHTHLHAYACRIYAAPFRASIGLHKSLPAHPDASPLSASCSSGQRFAYGFLRIRSRPRHPCLRLTLPLAGCVEDFHLQVRAPCRAHKAKAPLESEARVRATAAGAPDRSNRRSADRPVCRRYECGLPLLRLRQTPEFFQILLKPLVDHVPRLSLRGGGHLRKLAHVR